MICAPATGCIVASCCSSTSAGGQLSQPSDVNSSTITGVAGAATGRTAVAAAMATSASIRAADISAMLTEPLLEPNLVAHRNARKSGNLASGVRDDVVRHELDQAIAPP